MEAVAGPIDVAAESRVDEGGGEKPVLLVSPPARF